MFVACKCRGEQEKKVKAKNANSEPQRAPGHSSPTPLTRFPEIFRNFQSFRNMALASDSAPLADLITVPQGEKLLVTYGCIHRAIKHLSEHVKTSDSIPDVIIAIGTGGLIPGRYEIEIMKFNLSQILEQKVGFDVLLISPEFSRRFWGSLCFL
jgi:hypothetical protein